MNRKQKIFIYSFLPILLLTFFWVVYNCIKGDSDFATVYYCMVYAPPILCEVLLLAGGYILFKKEHARLSKVCLTLSCVFATSVIFIYVARVIAELSDAYVHFFNKGYYFHYSCYFFIISLCLFIISIASERIFKRPIKIAALVLVGAIFLTNVVSILQIFDPSRYGSYICYDSLLTCTDAYERTEYYSLLDGETSYRAAYRKPVGTDAGQFVCARKAPIFTLTVHELRYYVMQNPDDYVDVFSDWSIESIEIYYMESYVGLQNERKEPAYEIKEILISTGDEAAINDLLGFVRSDREEAGEQLPLIIPSLSLRMRVYFNESESIVWDSEIKKDSQGGFVIQKTCEGTDGALPTESFYSLKDSASLSSLIATALDSSAASKIKMP